MRTHSREPYASTRTYALCQLQRIFRFHAEPVHSCVDLEVHVEGLPGSGKRSLECLHQFRGVDDGNEPVAQKIVYVFAICEKDEDVLIGAGPAYGNAFIRGGDANVMHSQPRHPGRKLHQVRTIGHGFEHSQNVRAAAAEAAEAGDVALNRRQIDPLAALRNGAGEITHRFDHAGIARTFEEHRVTGPQKRQQLVFEFIGIADICDHAVRSGGLVTFRGALQFAVADEK